jgi:hypothetical protein
MTLGSTLSIPRRKLRSTMIMQSEISASDTKSPCTMLFALRSPSCEKMTTGPVASAHIAFGVFVRSQDSERAVKAFICWLETSFTVTVRRAADLSTFTRSVRSRPCGRPIS